MSRERLLQYARGGNAKEYYFAMYDVNESGEVMIHTCIRQLGGDSTFIRFCPYDGTAREINALYVPDEKIEAAIIEFMNNKRENDETNRTVSALLA